MTIDKEKLRAQAEAATQDHGARRVEVDLNGRNVIGDGSWKIFIAWHTPDGKGKENADFCAAASPSTILALLGEIERLERKNANQVESIREYQDLAAGGERLGELRADLRVTKGERDQLKAENEALSYLLKRFVDGEHDDAEDQSERHHYHGEAEALLARMGGDFQEYSLVPYEALWKQRAELVELRKDAERLDRLDKEGAGYGTHELEGYAWTVDGPFSSVRDAIDCLFDYDEAVAKEQSHG